MARDINELKEIFMTEHKYMLDNCFNLVSDCANKYNKNDLSESKMLYDELRKIAEERMKIHGVTDEEMKIIQENKNKWMFETVQSVLHKIKPTNHEGE